MMWTGAPTAVIVNFIFMACALSLVIADNVFNDDTVASKTPAETPPHYVDGLFGSFNKEVNDVVSSHPVGEILLKGSNNTRGSNINAKVTNQPGEFVLKGSNNTQDPKPRSSIMQLRNHVLRNKTRQRFKKRGQNNRQKKSDKRDDKKRRRKKQGDRYKKKRPNRGPRPGNSRPAQSRPANAPQNTNRPARTPSACFSIDMYESLDSDIASIKNSINNDREKSHFLGGIVRLAAHDFMDFDRRAPPGDRMGPDGCIDPFHDSNDGLETIWGNGRPLYNLYQRKYSHLSRADFWIAAANAVIRQTSIGNALDLQDSFVWGRRDRDTCRGSGERLPQASGCDEVEDVFLRNMGLEWSDAVALLGAHTLGRGNREFSGHDGTWASSDKEAQVFDTKYYKAFFTNSWRPRNMGRNKQDWTTGRGDHARMMLNTDMCLVFDIEEYVDRDIPCCTRTGSSFPNGQDQCIDMEAARRRCPMYSRMDRRREATDAVREMLGGSVSSNNNAPFYIAFAKAWRKATTVGQDNLFPLQDTC